MDTVDLTQGKWRLHTRLGAVNGWGAGEGEMGIPRSSGGNTDVRFTFVPPPSNTKIADLAAQLAPVAPSVVKPPSGLEAMWYMADFPEPPPGEPLDTQEARGEHWARVFPAAQSKDRKTQPCIQIVQMNWGGLEGSLRIFIGRLVLEEPKILFFGHGTGNDAPGVAHSFTLTQE